MTRSPDEVVTEFCAKWANPDPTELAAHFTDTERIEYLDKS